MIPASAGFATAAASTSVDFTPPAHGGTSFDSDHEHYVAIAGGVFTHAVFTDVQDALRELFVEVFGYNQVYIADELIPALCNRNYLCIACGLELVNIFYRLPKIPGESVIFIDQNDLDFSIKAGQIVSIIGPNGAGKTCLINCIPVIIDRKGATLAFRDRRY